MSLAAASGAATLTAAELSKAAVIVGVEVLLLSTSLLSIGIISTTPDLYDVIGCYFMSLSVADLLCALLIVPLSIYSALTPGWAFLGDNSLLCKAAAYGQIALFGATVYTFAWICIDRYSAMMKPSRYADQSLTRCKCWILFSWITSLLCSSPIVFAKMQVAYSAEAELCVLDWSATAAYSFTLVVLVFVPTIVTVANTGWKILKAMRNSHLVSFIFVWLAIAGPSSKFLIYIFINSTFRRSLLSSPLCLSCICPPATDRNHRRSEYANISNSSYL